MKLLTTPIVPKQVMTSSMESNLTEGLPLRQRAKALCNEAILLASGDQRRRRYRESKEPVRIKTLRVTSSEFSVIPKGVGLRSKATRGTTTSDNPKLKRRRSVTE